MDNAKLINGRKRHVVVDTPGLLLGVMATAADTGDRTAAQVLLHQVTDAHHRLVKWVLHGAVREGMSAIRDEPRQAPYVPATRSGYSLAVSSDSCARAATVCPP
ncbi:transposase [Streptomyces sp. NBC_01340]|uniref:transposase n=1 Tax=Streptomyces sp. NBC_01340 TaxID=2903830 RepID=UPI003DA442D4